MTYVDKAQASIQGIQKLVMLIILWPNGGSS